MANDPIHNPTILNNRPIQNEWFLANGDIIQLSVGGPILRFNIPQGGTIRTKGFSERFRLVAQQSIRPYRNVVIMLSVLVLALSCGGSYGIWHLIDENKEMSRKLTDVTEKLSEAEEKFRQDQKDFEEQLREQARRDNVARAKMIEKWKKEMNNKPQENVEVVFYDKVKPYVCFITVKEFSSNPPIKLPNGSTLSIKDYSWTCTGFIDQTGKFITARHCI